jgi:hypothetical protein
MNVINDGAQKTNLRNISVQLFHHIYFRTSAET